VAEDALSRLTRRGRFVEFLSLLERDSTLRPCVPGSETRTWRLTI
jgi:hypothetical protein